ncbi:MAG TPA: ring-cleaving dioxygenase [Capsulimonadaceae bacterium]|nr:ring-cleaving dioxygenase [Capsulimonadaceae bacterium]
MELTGLHHVTAVTGNAPANLDFYTRVLGLRLVKKTVNQDDVSAYHLFYGDEAGHPGTEVTFFDWPRTGPTVPGLGAISTISLRVPSRDALAWWQERLATAGAKQSAILEYGDRSVLEFTDPEGQRLQLIDDHAGKPGMPWQKSPVPAEQAIRGLGAVTLTVRNMAPTAAVLTEILMMRQTGEYERDGHRIVVYEMGPGGLGAEVHVEERPELSPVYVGAGGVHHVAFRTTDNAQQIRWLQRIREARLPVSQVIDRYYFQSIYFREPNGVLFEIATDGPGFAADEDMNHLGERLALPPFLEPRRQEIEAGLRPLDQNREAVR